MKIIASLASCWEEPGRGRPNFGRPGTCRDKGSARSAGGHRPQSSALKLKLKLQVLECNDDIQKRIYSKYNRFLSVSHGRSGVPVLTIVVQSLVQYRWNGFQAWRGEICPNVWRRQYARIRFVVFRTPCGHWARKAGIIRLLRYSDARALSVISQTDTVPCGLRWVECA